MSKELIEQAIERLKEIQSEGFVVVDNKVVAAGDGYDGVGLVSDHPVFVTMTRTIDALDYLRKLDTGSVDLIIADPPYNIGYDDGKGWDTVDDWLEWCVSWTTECVRVLKDGGVLIVWGTLKNREFLKYIQETDEIYPLVPQNEIIWSYNWGGRSKDNFARKHEYAFVWSKGKDFTFNADDVRVERKVKNNPRTGEPYTNGTIPTCVWGFNNHTMSKDFINWHPTTKNLDVLQRMIVAYTNVGGLVLDPFMGSGSTAVACIRTNRQYIGCEIDARYTELANERILKEISK